MDSTDILINIRKIVRSINLESKRIQKDYGVSIPQMLALNYLYRSEKYQASQRELKTYLNLNPSTVSGIIHRLEKKGLIARLPKLEDKRVANLALTVAGEKILKQIPPLLHERLTFQLTKLDELELKSIESVLDKLVQMLQIQAVEAFPVITDQEVE